MPGNFPIYARLILPVLGAIAGWFVFEEMIIAAAIGVLLGIAGWLSHKKRKNKERNKAGKYFY